MGGTGWEYVTPYRGSVGATLEALHEQVFQEDEEYRSYFGSREALYADEQFMAECGTHTVLDVVRILDSPEPPEFGEHYGTLRPLAPDRLVHHLGTERPTRRSYQEKMAREDEALRQGGPTPLNDEHTMRWSAVYVLLYTDGEPEPTHMGIFGSSGD